MSTYARLALSLSLLLVGLLAVVTDAQARPMPAETRHGQAVPHHARALGELELWLRHVRATSRHRVSDARVQVEAMRLRRVGPRVADQLRSETRRHNTRVLRRFVRREMRPSLRGAPWRLTRAQAFFLFTDLQRQLEDIGRAAGPRGMLTFRPNLPSGARASLRLRHTEFVIDQDHDGKPDRWDRNDDNDRLGDRRDHSDNVTGIPDRLMAREDLDLDRDEDGRTDRRDRHDGQRHCFFVDEDLPDFQTVIAATRFARARRGCAASVGIRRRARRAQVRARAAGVNNPPTSAPSNQSPPTLSGTATVGATLAAKPGTWSGRPTPTYSYSWQYQTAAGTWFTLSGVSDSTYTLQASDAGRVLRVEVVAKNSAGSATAASSGVGPVSGGNAPPVDQSPPTVTGTPKVGGSLVAAPGNWAGSPAPSFAYQWQRNPGSGWTDIAGETTASYTPAAADVGATLRVTVTASNASGSASASSSPIGPVDSTDSKPLNTALPTIAGAAQVGQAVQASPGSWSGSPAPSFSYQWQQGGNGAWTDIAGATAVSYTPTGGDAGAFLRVEVTAANASGATVADSQQAGPVGCSLSSSTDTDGDGVPDCQEITGFTLSVATTGTGATQQVQVTSDPRKPDTDGDSVPDGTEWQGRQSNPRLPDTDGDGLTDAQELFQYGSIPASVDSDGDALIPNSIPRQADGRLLDGTEVKGYAFQGDTISTSPILADTDGDNLSDYYELTTGGYNPLVADMPQIQVDTDPSTTADIQVPAVYSDTQAKTTYQGSLQTSTDSTKTTSVDMTDTKEFHTDSYGVKAGVSREAADATPFVSPSVQFTGNWQRGSTTDHRTGTTTQSVHETQSEYQSYAKDESSHGVEVQPTGTFASGVILRNTGNVAVTAKDVQVTAMAIDPGTGAFKPFATLTLPNDTAANGITIGPGESKGTYRVSDSTVSSTTLLALMAQPGGLVYSIPSPALFTADGKDYANIGQAVNAQTAEVSIDDGTKAPRTSMVASNVARTARGESAGVSLSTVMNQILDRSYKTCPSSAGPRVLCGVGGVNTTDKQHFWIVLHSDDVDMTKDFDDIVLHHGSFFHMLYITDTDGEGLYDREEALYGTDPANKDSDCASASQCDGLDDFQETSAGWQVPYPDQAHAYGVFSNPLSVDVDQDGSYDGCPGGQATCGPNNARSESARRTDPGNPDTNDDGIVDGLQGDADVLAYCPNCYRVPRYLTQFGTGTGAGSLSNPTKLAVNPRTGNLYVADYSYDAVVEYDRTGKFIRQFGGTGAADWTGEPWTTAIDAKGQVWVAEGSGPSVKVFDQDGTYLFTATTGGPYVTGVAADAQGNVYIVDTTKTIGRYDMSGQRIATAVLPDTMASIADIAVTGAGDLLYVSDPVGGVVRVYRQGVLVQTIRAQNGQGPVAPTTVALAPHNTLYVFDQSAGRVFKYTTGGTLQASWGGPGSGPGLFNPSSGVAVDPSDCSVYVSSTGPTGTSGVQKFVYPNGCG